MTKFEFEVQDTFMLSLGPAVLVKLLGDKVFDSLSSINGVKILNIQVPRKIDVTGKFIENVWVFHLESSTELNKFKNGQIVEAI